MDFKSKAKETYMSPMVLEHQKLVFETIISGSHEFPPGDDEDPGGGGNPGGDGDPGGNGDPGGDGDPGGNGDPGGGGDGGGSGGGSGSGGGDSTSQDTTVTTNTDAEPSSQQISQAGSSTPQASLSPIDLAILSQGKETFPSTQANRDTYHLPNTGTLWYTWGLESIIIAGLSGLTIWYTKNKANKKWGD